jgi:hypothetical protein
MQTLPFFGASWCNNPTLIPRFMKGFFNIKPLPYKPNLTWDVSKVLKFISTLMPLESLNLKMLTYKLIALVALTTAARAQTLSALYLNYMSLFHDKLSFTICSLLKTSRPGRRNPDIVIYKFDDSNLCVLSTLKEYIKRTEHLRKSSILFVSFFNFEAVTTSTLARWLKCVLSLSGVDSCFKAHSYRSASTSCAYKKGVSIKDIMETANWTSARTFYKH